MDEPIVQLFWVIVFQAKSDIVLCVEPYPRWIVVLDYYPLPDVEFATFDQQWIFNVLLNDILSLFPK
jgi:hypothetical protein